jgi:hypothetical protein
MASKNPQSLEVAVSDYDLWVLPNPTHSQTFARVDWYLNWQMSKGLAHQRLKPSVELHRVMEEAGLTFTPQPELSGAPMMVASFGKVASSRCVVMEFTKDLSPWLKSIHQLAAGLHAKRMRVYLPTGQTADVAETHWKKLSPLPLEIEFSTDEETT